MKQERLLGYDVFYAAYQRVKDLYENKDMVIVSFSGGKDSTCCLELAIMAARETGNLPVKVAMRDDEIMYPPVWEYCERVAKRKEIEFHWVYANQPVLNIYNRVMPYYWAFDPELDPEEWVRKPPEFAYKIPVQNINYVGGPEMFPPEYEGQRLVNITGLRVAESPSRRMGLHSSKGYLTKYNSKSKKHMARPIYDWKRGDVWKFIKENNFDYCTAYDTMFRLAGKGEDAGRIAPPFMAKASLNYLSKASQAWPRWFDKCCKRVGGIRTAAQFGMRAVTPQRRLKETWKECFHRTCIEEAPDWIGERAAKVAKEAEKLHSRHSTSPLPENNKTKCPMCRNLGSWQALANTMFNGDPFAMKVGNMGTKKDGTKIDYIEPEFFRTGAGTWGGPASW